MSESPQSETPKKDEHTWTETIEIAGKELVDRVKGLIAEGNVRRLIIRRENGETLLEIPLTPAVAVGGVLTIFYPLFAALGAMAALLARFKIEVVRSDQGDKK